METSKNVPCNHLVSEIALVYKSKIKASERPVVSTSQHVYRILINHWDKGKIEMVEEFKILLLNSAKQVLGIMDISIGGLTYTAVDIRLIFMAALKTNATTIILAHNHPSSSLTPSEPDKQTTRKIVEAARFMDIKILDHLIVIPTGYYSFADEGIL